jgi:dihydrodipicolinate synthase/N-acetylneuraminate lyase
VGAVGGILAAAVFAPALAMEVVERFRAGDTPGAGRAQERLTPLHRDIVAAYGAVGVKAALDQLGWQGGPPRAPLQRLGDKDRRALVRSLESAGLAVPT